MSTIVTEQIVKDVGESWFTLKMDGTKDPTGRENVSIVVRYVDKDFKGRRGCYQCRQQTSVMPCHSLM
ncbi:unnamed protein product [Knipowitschia caucasica]